MSTQTPLIGETCGTCYTGWLTCKIKASICKAQKLLEPLCERRDHQYEKSVHDGLLLYRANVLDELYTRGGYSEALDTIPMSMRGWREWADLAKAEMVSQSMLKHHDIHRMIVAGELTLANRIGMFFAYGTSCPCCLGYRIIAAGIIAFFVGKLAS